MRLEVNVLVDISEFSIGLFMTHGEDDLGEFHMTTIGFLLFSIDIFKYKN